MLSSIKISILQALHKMDICCFILNFCTCVDNHEYHISQIKTSEQKQEISILCNILVSASILCWIIYIANSSNSFVSVTPSVVKSKPLIKTILFLYYTSLKWCIFALISDNYNILWWFISILIVWCHAWYAAQ